MKNLLFIPLIFLFGCSELVTYTIVSTATFTGNVLAEEYEDYNEDKKSTNKKENDGLRHKTSK